MYRLEWDGEVPPERGCPLAPNANVDLGSALAAPVDLAAAADLNVWSG